MGDGYSAPGSAHLLPEPLVQKSAAPSPDDPAALQELADDLSTAFLLLLERLTPVERAVFLLRESFDFNYREIADIVCKTRAAQKPIHGAEGITRFLFGLRKNAPPDWEIRPAILNGRTGLLNLVGGKVFSAMTFQVEDGQIQGIYVVVNPDKLGRVDTSIQPSPTSH